MKKIMILGAGIYQVPLIRKAKEMGLYTIVVSTPGEYPGFSIADKIYELDTRDKEGILKAARAESINGICTSGTDVAVASIGFVCEQMGLCGISEHAAGILTDKSLMKQSFLKGGVSAAEGMPVKTKAEALAEARHLGFPVVVKRVDSSGSRGITVVHSESKIEDAFLHALNGSSKEYVLVEKFLIGKEIGVDGFVQNKKLTFLAPHDKFVFKGSKTTVPVGHKFPYTCSPKVMEEIGKQMQLAVTAVGADQCPVNADVFVDGDQVSVIEMGGRTGATCIPELISRSYNFDFYECMLRNALGEAPHFPSIKPRLSMAKLLLSPVNGSITRIDFDALAALESDNVEISLDFPVGHKVYAMNDGTDRIGQVITTGMQEQELAQLINRIYSYIYIDDHSLEELWKN